MSTKAKEETKEPKSTEDDEEDLEKLQEEIRRMEEEAARIAKQTEELQNANKPATASTSTTNSAPAEKRER